MAYPASRKFTEGSCVLRNPGKQLTVDIVGFTVAVATIYGNWLVFPVSYSIKGVDLLFDKEGSIPLVAPYVVLLFSGLIFSAIGRSAWSMASISASVPALFLCPLHVTVDGYEYIENYVRDSQYFDGLQKFISEQFIPNTGLDTPKDLLKEFSSIGDRFGIVFSMLGPGWYAALLAVLVLILNRMLALKDAGQRVLGWIVSPIVISVILATGLGWDVWFSEYQRRRGDGLLYVGNYHGALAAYEQAIHTDPILRLADPFLVNLARAQYALKGGDSLGGLIYVAYLNMNKQKYESALQALDQFDVSSTLGQAYGMSDVEFRDFASRLRAAAHKNVANTWYQQKNVSAARVEYRDALRATPHALDLKFFVVKTGVDLRQYGACEESMNSLISLVSSSKIRADFYSTLGDCYVGIMDVQKARDAYTNAYGLDNRENYRALKGLSGT